MRNQQKIRMFRLAVAAIAVAFLAAACGSGGGESSSTPGNTTGVTDTSVKFAVAVSDLDGLRAAGISLAPAMTTGNLSKRMTSYFDEWNAAGGFYGRKVEPIVLTWDPTKPQTAEKLCADVTINNEVFGFINASGVGAKYVQCIVDAGVPSFIGDVAPQSAHDTGWGIFTKASAEMNATAGVRAAVDSGRIPKGATVGVLAGNGPEHVASVNATRAVLEANGNKVVVAKTNTLQGDPGAQNAESATAVNTFKSQGVTQVVVALQFTAAGGFWDNVSGTNWQFTVLDIASSMCSAYGARSLKASAVGSVCYTTDGDAVTADGRMRTETPFETECRAKFDALSTNDYGGAKSYPGVPSGEVRNLPDGQRVSSDYAPNECMFANVISKALEKAGKNLTRENFMKAVRGLGDLPYALGSDGKGSQENGKTYIALYLHGVKLTAAPTGTAKGTNGLYNGCPVDVQCWTPIEDRWYPIEQ